MAPHSSKLRPGRVGRLLLRAVLDQTATPQREPIMPASTGTRTTLLRVDRPEIRDRDFLRA